MLVILIIEGCNRWKKKKKKKKSNTASPEKNKKNETNSKTQAINIGKEVKYHDSVRRGKKLTIKKKKEKKKHHEKTQKK